MADSGIAHFRLTPFDTAMFRDARPFSAEDADGAHLGSLVPPQLGVLGALRNLLIDSAGIRYDDFKVGMGTKALGSGPEHPGSLALGPVLWAVQEGNDVTVEFPAPADLIRWHERRRSDSGIGFHLPYNGNLETNLPSGTCLLMPARVLQHGRARFIEMGAGTEVEGDIGGLPAGSLERYLLGDEPRVMSRPQDFFSRELRVGIERNPATGTVREGMLYTAELLRLKVELPKRSRFYTVSVYSGAEEFPSGPSVICVGGERRPFEFRLDPLITPATAETRAKIEDVLKVGTGVLEFRLYLLSPAPPGEGENGWRAPLPEIDGVSLSVFAAAVPRWQWLSGWSIGRPLAAQPCIPAGAVYFVRAQSQLPRATVVERIMDAFWYRPALCAANGATTEELLAAKSGYGVTLIGALRHAE